MIDVTVSSQSAPITLDWLQTQNKSVTELQKELSDPSQLEAFQKIVKSFPKPTVQKHTRSRIKCGSSIRKSISVV